MKKLDAYILKKYFSTFIFVFGAFMLVAIVIDISEKLEDFTKPNWKGETPSLREIVKDYYFSFIPYMGAILTPVFLFIGVIFFTSKLAYNSEIVALAGNGVSLYRFLQPYLLGGIILAGGLYFANHYLVPHANKNRLAFEFEHIRHIKYSSEHIMREPQPGEFFYLRRFINQGHTGQHMSLETFDGTILKSKIRAQNVEWNPEKKTWRLKNVRYRFFDGKKERYQFKEVVDTTLAVQPSDFDRHTDTKDEMTKPALQRFIKEEQEMGNSKLEFFRVERHRRSAEAFSLILITLMGATLGARKIRGGMGLNLVAGVALCAILVIFSKFSITFSTKGNLPPFLGAWIPNIIFGLLTILLIRQAPK